MWKLVFNIISFLLLINANLAFADLGSDRIDLSLQPMSLKIPVTSYQKSPEDKIERINKVFTELECKYSGPLSSRFERIGVLELSEYRFDQADQSINMILPKINLVKNDLPILSMVRLCQFHLIFEATLFGSERKHFWEYEINIAKKSKDWLLPEKTIFVSDYVGDVTDKVNRLLINTSAAGMVVPYERPEKLNLPSGGDFFNTLPTWSLGGSGSYACFLPNQKCLDGIQDRITAKAA
ncbi:MAG: hypothetical protein A4S09_14005 [Proteobacteria bacterium SG_bin7]|nr:MAG: hypothetical protein A4S09_14005 [Proteobacteria bacterium SG_bin7]